MDWFTLRLASLSAIATLVIVLLIVADLVARNFLNSTIPGAAEISISLLVLMIYGGIAGAQAAKGHFNVTVLHHVVSPRARWCLAGLSLLLLAAIAAVLAYLTWSSAMTSLARREASWGIVTIPIWPARIAVTVGFSLLGLQALIDLLRHLIRPLDADKR